jgi:hypothetical protein
MKDLIAVLLHIGSRILAYRLVCKTMLNDKSGFIVNQEGDRWGVVILELDCEPGVRKIWKMKPENSKAFLSRV